MKVKCPECREEITIEKNEHEEGDTIECSECGASCTILLKRGKFVLEPEDLKTIDEEEFGLDQEYED